jgi:Tol biopolymer transport system component
MPLASGTKLGPYQIVAPIGAGGMGEVYRAKDTRLEREVAVKVLPEALAGNEQFLSRFEREARSISSLNHPHICTLHDVGHQEGTHFLVMELLDGESLADRIDKKGALPTSQVLAYGAQIADALHHAHRHGIVHRDLKPGNVVLTKNGAKLLDFGLARTALEAQGVIQGLTTLPTQVKPLTQEGTILGTFQYMAPEQLEGLESDARTDIFALGMLLYEMATGRKAFEGKSRTSLIAAIVSSQPPAVSSVQPMAPPALDHVIRKCLEKNPDDRWQSAHDVAGELRWIAEGGSQAGLPVVAVARQSWRRLAWGLAGVIAGAALAAAWFTGFQVRPPVEAPVTRSAILPPEGKRFQLSGLNGGPLTLSPDGRYLTFKISSDGEDLLWLRPLGSLTTRPLPGTNHAMWPFWSPDSRFIAFFAEGKLKKVDLAGSPAVTLCEAAEGRSGSWSQDGTLIFSTAPNEPIVRVSSAGGKVEAITQLDEDRRETTHRWATFLPDGRHFLYLAGTHNAGVKSETNAVYLGELGSREKTLLLQVRSNVTYASGYLLYVRDKILLAQPFDAERLKLTGDPTPLGEAVGYDTDFFRGRFAASTNGTLVYSGGAAESDVRLVWVDRAGKELSEAGPPGDYRSLNMSPDGKKVAYELADPDSGTRDIWVQDLTRPGRTRLTFGASSESNPVWSPDGTRIIYSIGAKLDDLFMRPAAGGNEEVVLRSEMDKRPTDWSSDGKYVLFDATDRKSANRWDIWVLPLTGERKPFPYTSSPSEEQEGHFSPDGKWIVYTSDESGKTEIYAAPFPATGAKWQVSTGGGVVGFWSRDGKEITYISPDQTLMSVSVAAHEATLDLASPQKVFTQRNAVGGASSPDGKKLLLALRPETSQDLPILLINNWPAALVSK